VALVLVGLHLVVGGDGRAELRVIVAAALIGFFVECLLLGGGACLASVNYILPSTTITRPQG
jgi:hypothetical protein